MLTPESVNQRPSRYIWSFCLVSQDTHTTSEQHWLLHRRALDLPRQPPPHRGSRRCTTHRALASAGGAAALLLRPQLSKNHKTYLLNVVPILGTHK